MKIKLAMFLILLVSVSIPSVMASSQLSVVVQMNSSTIYAGDVPIITGKVIDQLRKPVPDVSIRVDYPSEVINATSSTDGSFKIIPTKPASVGEYGISVIATKDGYDVGMSVIEYSVLEKPTDLSAIDVFGIQKGVQDVGTMMVNGLTQNPIAEILAQQVDLVQKQQQALEQKQAEIQKENNLLEEQRKLVNDNLQQDLAQMDKDAEFYNPFNVFGRFVSDVDSSVQNIFWGQFNLTQQQHVAAYKAKMEALENKQDSKDAMMIYREKAAVSRDKIIQLNNDLNVRYSNSSSYTQNLFDSQGKLRN
ncbi:MAG TPA: carboxypeptidase-like regulatory domain-containing protein [Candidatus Nitrosotenuis sp.]|nr:carboxypeptidase-like regulatory domain-containing protein [Candidatus Nitrosotenuis sp.]